VERARASGVLLHITSLPGGQGIGDLGPAAFRFGDWLAAAGQRIWQVLPLGPVGYGDSPYQLLSAFAGNPMLLSLEALAEHGLLSQNELKTAPPIRHDRVDFETILPWKFGLLRRAFERSRTGDHQAEFAAFQRENEIWLGPLVRFMALKETHLHAPWWEWSSQSPPSEDEEFQLFLQFEFARQWDALRRYCHRLGIRLMGDLPIYLARDSADVWSHPELFRDDAVSGVPPDYFSATGQLWGNPLYHWERMAAQGYRWWIERMRTVLRHFDLLRIDHFRGFEAYWEVPTGETTAVNGRWVKGPGAAFFRALEAELGRLPVVAENLGVITPTVEALRNEFGFPGMAVLQFGFGKDPQAPTFLPHNYVPNLVAYTGTHDNDTALGWWHSEGGDSTRTAQDIQLEKARARAYLGTDGYEINWTLIRTLMMSVADTVLVPLQDILGLGSEARMNTPATTRGNWRWRCPPEALTDELAIRLKDMAKAYER
jgi:4-alpha-glucanotransferase